MCSRCWTLALSLPNAEMSKLGVEHVTFRFKEITSLYGTRKQRAECPERGQPCSNTLQTLSTLEVYKQSHYFNTVYLNKALQRTVSPINHTTSIRLAVLQLYYHCECYRVVTSRSTKRLPCFSRYYSVPVCWQDYTTIVPDRQFSSTRFSIWGYMQFYLEIVLN
jgi:hypothetical protein